MGSAALSISLWQKLEELDKWLFIKINSDLTNSFFDTVIPYFRDSVFWVPLYLFIGAFVFYNYGKKAFWWCIAFMCTVALTDLVGTHLFKHTFQRLRPCQDPLFYSDVRLLLKQCSGSYSFVSNHAANHFGLATFMVLTFKNVIGKWMYAAFAWASLICYAQLYVGVHYPSDIVGGTLLGMGIGWLTATLYRKNGGHNMAIN